MEQVSTVRLADFPSRKFIAHYKLVIQFFRSLELDDAAFYEKEKKDVLYDGVTYTSRIARINYRPIDQYFFEVKLIWTKKEEPLLTCECSPMSNGGSTRGKFTCTDIEQVKEHLRTWCNTLQWYENEQAELDGNHHKTFGDAFMNQMDGLESEVDPTPLNELDKERWISVLEYYEEGLRQIEGIPEPDKEELLNFIAKAKNSIANITKGTVNKKWKWFKSKISTHGPKVLKALTDEVMKRGAKFAIDQGVDLFQKAIQHLQ